MVQKAQEFRMVKFLALTVLVIVITTPACGASNNIPPISEETFSFLVRVQTEGTSQNIPNAKVIIEVSEQAPLDEITDVNGLVRIPIAASYAGKSGRLLIEANGFELYRQEINLTKGALPDTILLKPSFLGEPIPINTAIPVVIDKAIVKETVNPLPESTPTVLSCLFQEEINVETFRQILNAEAQALIGGDLELYKQIYSEDAYAVDVTSNKVSKAHEYGQTNIIERKWLKLEHYDVRIVRASEEKAWVVNSVRGSFIDLARNKLSEFDTKVAADHRIFVKNQNGCWVVESLEFNAAKKQFP